MPGLFLPNASSGGVVQLLNDLLAGGTLEAWNLKLFSSNTTPSESDVPSTYTEATFTGYASKSLTRSQTGTTWSAAAAGSPTNSWSSGITGVTNVAEATYNSGTPQSWTATSAQTIYGYFYVGATSTKLIGSEKFSSSVGLVNPSTLSLTPRLGLSHS